MISALVNLFWSIELKMGFVWSGKVRNKYIKLNRQIYEIYYMTVELIQLVRLVASTMPLAELAKSI